MGIIELLFLIGLLVLMLLVVGGFIMHIRYFPSRPLLATFGFVAVFSLILTVFSMMFMLISMD